MVYIVQVRNLDKPCTINQWAGDRIVGGPVSLAQPLGKWLWCATDRHRAKVFAIKELQAAGDDPAQPMSLLQNRVKHRCQIAGRGIDDL